MSDDLVKRLRTSWDAQRSIMLQTDAWMSERHLAADRIEQLTAGLKSLVEICEITRDTSGFYKKAQAHQITPQQWSSWCKQIKTARAALKGESQ